MESGLEAERLAALAERRQEWAGTPGMKTFEDRFGPGSFGYHEALHVNHLILELIERELGSHSAVLLDPHWHELVQKAQDLLSSAYQHAGAAHTS
jgi:hypothetical protein